MTPPEFVLACTRGGYATRAESEKYMADNPKDQYTTDDIIALYHSKPDPVVMHGQRRLINGGYTTKRYPSGNSGRGEQDG